MSKRKLTVILCDESPVFFGYDSPTYRSVQIELTPEQSQQIETRFCYSANGTKYYERISKCFIEPIDSAVEGDRSQGGSRE